MNKLLLILLMFVPAIVMGQTDEKYLSGAITQKDGRITFDTEIQAPSLSQEEIYDTMLKWAQSRFVPTNKMNARIVFTDKSTGDIAVSGEEYMVFSSSALSLDRTRIYYQLLINCKPGKCNLEMTRIRYWYDEARDGGDKYSAEEWISDEMALNKSKSKLAPICGKFRRKTIDLKDELFKSAQSAIGDLLIAKGVNKVPVTAETVAPMTKIVPATPTVPATTITATPDNIIASATRITITAGNDENIEIAKECWGGFGQIFGKEVSFCVIDTQKTMANMLLNQSDNYTISFYNGANSNPVMTIKCKKISQQPLSGTEANKMNAKNDAAKSYNMYIGEIVKK